MTITIFFLPLQKLINLTNENGFAESNVITIPAIGYDEDRISLHVNRNTLEVAGATSRMLKSGNLTCSVDNILNPCNSSRPDVAVDGTIDIADIAPGFYVASLSYKGKIIATVKIQK